MSDRWSSPAQRPPRGALRAREAAARFFMRSHHGSGLSVAAAPGDPLKHRDGLRVANDAVQVGLHHLRYIT